ncbi:hypothetical protein DOTSEDRAFT_74227 [Dothistroma septosporum NZE10]|uniref:Uncharacterized protein n=1 Tax=Dothistroma septosporum (strain NZE10 / CBS 128990) TaxID=675120 RepID=N1PDD0_DOTSN|nr:hypothetical protein DOTSEDRAFT_74227 [Dothistroma septosporum NZE10]
MTNRRRLHEDCTRAVRRWQHSVLLAVRNSRQPQPQQPAPARRAEGGRAEEHSAIRLPASEEPRSLIVSRHDHHVLEKRDAGRDGRHDIVKLAKMRETCGRDAGDDDRSWCSHTQQQRASADDQDTYERLRCSL